MTKITYIPDYNLLGGQSGLSTDMIKIIEKRTFDMAACTDDKTSVFLNDTKVEYKNFEKYKGLQINLFWAHAGAKKKGTKSEQS